MGESLLSNNAETKTCRLEHMSVEAVNCSLPIIKILELGTAASIASGAEEKQDIESFRHLLLIPRGCISIRVIFAWSETVKGGLLGLFCRKGS